MRQFVLGLVGVWLLGFCATLRADETDGEMAVKSYGEFVVGSVWAGTNVNGEKATRQ